MRDALFVLFTALLMIGLQVTSFGFLVSSDYKPDLFSILVIWCGLRTGFVLGLCLSFCIGLLVDASSGAPAGLFALLYGLVYLAAGHIYSVLRTDAPVAVAAMVFGASLFAAVGVIFVRWLDGPLPIGWNTAAWVMSKSFISAAASVIVFPILERLYDLFLRVIGAA